MAIKELIEGAVGSTVLIFPFLQIDLGRWSPWGRVLRVKRRFDRILLREIARRREGGQTHDDLLGDIMTARDEDGRPLDDASLRDELVTLLVAGHETAAVSLAWAVERVLSTAGVHEQLLEELDREDSGNASHARIAALPYLDAVVKETLRTRAVFPNNTNRRLARDMDLFGYHVAKGTTLTVATQLVNHDPDVYPDPAAFRPDRFLGEAGDPARFATFGGGARHCIGVHLATFEIKVMLARLFSQRALTLDNPNCRPQRRGFLLMPAKGAIVRCRIRSGSRLRSGHVAE
jgi:cytochrome P450